MSVTVSYLDQSQLKDILEISDSRLGKNYLHPADFNKSNALTLVATADGDVVGFALQYFMDSNDFPVELKSKFPQPHKTVYFKSIAVKNGCDGKGYGNALLQMALSISKNHGALCSYGYMWIQDGFIPMAGLAKQYGFKELVHKPQFWMKSSIKRGFLCPHCGSICACDAIMIYRPFVKQLTE